MSNEIDFLNPLFEQMGMQHRAHNCYRFIILIQSYHGGKTFVRSRADLREKFRHLEELQLEKQSKKFHLTSENRFYKSKTINLSTKL